MLSTIHGDDDTGNGDILVAEDGTYPIVTLNVGPPRLEFRRARLN